MELKDRLKLSRKNAGKTQKDVAEHVKITQPTLSQLESGLLASSSSLPAIANFLGVDAFWLATGHGNPTSNSQGDLKGFQERSIQVSILWKSSS